MKKRVAVVLLGCVLIGGNCKPNTGSSDGSSLLLLAALTRQPKKCNPNGRLIGLNQETTYTQADGLLNFDVPTGAQSVTLTNQSNSGGRDMFVYWRGPYCAGTNLADATYTSSKTYTIPSDTAPELLQLDFMYYVPGGGASPTTYTYKVQWK